MEKQLSGPDGTGFLPVGCPLEETEDTLLDLNKEKQSACLYFEIDLRALYRPIPFYQ